jgi:3-phenylpropionate/cinnamic acid dioxygenase small subunit
MLSSRDAICQLIYTYAERIDAGDFAGVGELLGHAEVTFEGYDTKVTGVEAVTALYTATTRRYADGTPSTKHVMTNVIVDLSEDEETATSRSYFTVLQAVPGHLALQPVIAGRYVDRFERIGHDWRFVGMHVVVDLVGDLSAHLLQEI